VADKYIDGELASGTQSGDDWTNAYYSEANIQGAYDQLVAGDTLHCTRTQTLTATIDVDQADGTADSPITVKGYNYNGGAHQDDGTRYVINANSAATNCVKISKSFWVFDNVEFANAIGDNVTSSTPSAQKCVFKNCISHHAGLSGWGPTGGIYFINPVFILCQAYNNGTNGFFVSSDPRFIFCTAHTNGGVTPTSRGMGGWGGFYVGCVSYNNANRNYTSTSIHSATFFGCVSDDPTSTGFNLTNCLTTSLALCQLSTTN